MGASTGIAWTDATWNPVTGCTEVSPGCDHCYARSIATRFAGTPAYPAGFAVTLRPERLTLPLRWTRPRRVFVNSMSDLFHRDVPDAYIARVFAVMALANQHTFQVLTKRHGRMRSLLSSPWFVDAVAEFTHEYANGREYLTRFPAPNVWLGVSAEDQQRWHLRVPALNQTPAAVRFVSAEPLVGVVRIPAIDAGIDWVIIGGESGAGARPMDASWVDGLLDDADDLGITPFVKQAGIHLARARGWTGKGDDPAEWPERWTQARRYPR